MVIEALASLPKGVALFELPGAAVRRGLDLLVGVAGDASVVDDEAGGVASKLRSMPVSRIEAVLSPRFISSCPSIAGRNRGGGRGPSPALAISSHVVAEQALLARVVRSDR